MSRAATRVATDNANVFQLPSVSTWHPFYLTMSGQDVPCHRELLRLAMCMESAKGDASTKCEDAHRALKKCLEDHF